MPSKAGLLPSLCTRPENQLFVSECTGSFLRCNEPRPRRISLALGSADSGLLRGRRTKQEIVLRHQMTRPFSRELGLLCYSGAESIRMQPGSARAILAHCPLIEVIGYQQVLSFVSTHQ